MKILKKNIQRNAQGFLVMGLLFILLSMASVALYLGLVKKEIDDRMEQLRSSHPSQFFAQIPNFKTEQIFTFSELKARLEDQGYLEKKTPDDLNAQEYHLSKSTENKRTLTLYRGAFADLARPLDRLHVQIQLQEDKDLITIKEIIRTDTQSPINLLEGIPKRLGAYYAGRVRTQRPIALSDIPVTVRHAVMAIEDVHFLEHNGVSIRSTLRALWKDLLARRFVQGGSTLTQQLMKNLFFSREKALSRKLKEALYALIAEATHSKESILEAYLNEVYMGQWSTHEVHGVAEGAMFYFNRPVDTLSLSQSALLAAIIQVPNALDPYKNPDKTIARRNLVLKKMLEADFILPDEHANAVQEPLGVASTNKNLQSSNYFMELVLQSLPDSIKNLLDSQSLTVFTSLDSYLQANAAHGLKTHLEALTKQYPHLKKLEAKNRHLQGALIAVDVQNCQVLALQGGSSYKETQFNRILQGKRQPGSLFKPFVYLTALEKDPENINPLTLLEGAPFEWAYDKEIWKPRNYDKKYPEKVTLREALENSINVPTARLAQRIGIQPIVDNILKAGFKSPIPVFPSVSLGSAEVTPFEIAQAYTALANLGKTCPLLPYSQVYDDKKNLILQTEIKFEEKFPVIPTFQTVNILKGVMTRGTGRYTATTGLPVSHLAGKSGTTNDYKDAWFIGFSPHLLTLVWIGYDEEEKVGLTGSAAALPLWIQFMKSTGITYIDENFKVPDSLINAWVIPEKQCLASSDNPNKVEEYFISGTEPKQRCD